MNIEQFRDFCLSLHGTTERFPFDDTALVFEVGGRMFAMVALDRAEFVNLKCDPDRAVELRERYAGIRPGWHMNKRHWNSVYLDSDVPDGLICELVRHSRSCVIARLPKSVRELYEDNDSN